MPTPPKDCQIQACSLQTCLNKNTYLPEKCNQQLFELYECCSNLYEVAQQQSIDPTSCPNERIVKRWLKQNSSLSKKD